MFTIDLRKGAGLPPKSRPFLVVLAMMPFLIPMLGTLVMAACWQHNRTLIQTQQKVIHENQHKISGLENDLKQYHHIDEQINLRNQQLQDVSQALRYRVQLTPILAELVGNFPESLIIKKLDMDRSDQRTKETNPKTGNVDYVVTVQRKLRMTIGGPATGETDNAVEQYVQKLFKSPGLMKWFANIRITSRNNDTLNDKNYAFYDIECVMKDQS
jgi:hypothetical protein